MKVFENNSGFVEEIRSNHFRVTVFTKIGSYSIEARHATLDEVIYNNLV